jgi:hypothetical protein
MPSPLHSKDFQIFYAQIAQSVEQGTENPCVGGSIPPLGTIKKAIPVRMAFLFL